MTEKKDDVKLGIGFPFLYSSAESHFDASLKVVPAAGVERKPQEH